MKNPSAQLMLLEEAVLAQLVEMLPVLLDWAETADPRTAVAV